MRFPSKADVVGLGYNRDLSVVAIKAWSEMLAAEKKAVRQAKALNKQKNKKRKLDEVEQPEGQSVAKAEAADASTKVNKYPNQMEDYN